MLLSLQTDRLEPALRLLVDVAIFVLAELLFADSGATMELGRTSLRSAAGAGASSIAPMTP
jgi:hypothetical protein